MVKRVMVVGTGRSSRGGINSVIRAYTQTSLWEKWHCYWLETHIDKGLLLKFIYYLKAFFLFLVRIPFYQLVHLHLSEPPSAFRKLIFIRLAKIFGKPVLVHFHSFSTDTTIEGPRQNLYYKVFKASDKIIVLSDKWRSSILQKWPGLSDKLIILYNPCPVIKPGLNHIKSKSILFAGGLIDRKGYHDLISGFSLIAEKNKQWQLVFAGNGEVEKGMQMATDLKIKDQVVFKGWVNGAVKDDLFRSASIFCLPSYAEGFPMSVLEAWAYGLPVVTTMAGGLADIVIDHENALVTEPGNRKQISTALDNLINDAELRNKLSDKSLILSSTIFSIGVLSGKLDSLYTSMCSR
jgi:glycosyltransferase involved in cell wall biosynthesis